MSLKTLISGIVMPLFGLTGVGETIAPNEGLIAHNFIVPTAERADVLFRCYPKISSKTALGYGTEQAKFELRTLVFLAEKGVPTPKQSDLSPSVVKDTGELLARIIQVSAEYTLQEDEPNGDIEYIKTILNNFLSRRPDMTGEKAFGDLFNKLNDPALNDVLSKTPKGLVHGDFFYENVLWKDAVLVSVVDFGDAYYGHVIMDIAIGSMEFAMKEGEAWDLSLHELFLVANKDWLAANEISFDLFHNVLLANCARFTAHLCNLQQDELEQKNNLKGEIDLSLIPYIERLYMFQHPKVKEELRRCYDAVIR